MSVLSSSHAVLATMGGVSTTGPLIIPGESSTAMRELVELEKSGELFMARPRNGLVKLITLYAPGLKQGHLILRELLTSEGKQTLLLTAPDAVKDRVKRATLYTRGLQKNMLLFENINGVWEKRLPQSFLIDSPIEETESKQTLQAFPIKSIGFYWLLEPTIGKPGALPLSEATSARTLMGGQLTWGLLPSIFGILLFIFFGTLSRYIHKSEKIGGF